MLRAYRREIVDAMLQCKERSSFIPALANSFAKRITEVPVAHAERAAGDSKYGFWKLINLQFDLLTSFSLLPLQMLSVLGVVVSALGIGFASSFWFIGSCTQKGRHRESLRCSPCYSFSWAPNSWPLAY